MTEASDDELMLMLQGGDSQAFRALVERHQRPLMGFFVRQTRDPQLAEDLTQETLLRVYNQSWDYLPRGQFRGWMFRVARNLLIDNVRRRSSDALVHSVKGSSSDDDDEPLLTSLSAESRSPDDQASIAEVTRVVDELLPELPEEQRLTFQMYHFLGLSLPEIADSLETNLPTTKSRLRLAREKLQDQLRARGFRDPQLPEAE